MLRFTANISMMFCELDFLDRFAAAAKAGFKGVENRFPDNVSVDEISTRLKANDLKQVLINTPPGDWSAGDRGMACHPARVDEFRDSIARAIDVASALECDRLHCMAGLVPEDADAAELRKTYVENLKFASAEMGRAGIKCLMEMINNRDMPGFYLNTSAQAVSIMEDVGSNNLYIQYDIYHMQIMEGDLAPTMERLLPRIAHMQLADTPGRHEPGTGEINFPYLLKHIDAIGYQGWVGCEYVPATTTLEGLGWMDTYR